MDESERPTLEEWLEGWAEAVESGQSHISRAEATRRYYKQYGRDDGHQNGEG